MTLPLLNALSDQNDAVILCGENRLPNAMLLNLDSNKTQGESYRAQIEASEPLKKRLWRQIVEAKIYSVYVRHCASKENMQVHINRVRKSMPPSGYTSILSVTDKQYSETLNYWGKIERARPETPHQLEFF